jgi:hypothetical protein
MLASLRGAVAGMRRFRWILFVAMLALPVAAPAVHADKRVALVIGNAKYVHEVELDNPGNDARAVAGALKRIRFDEVDVVLDADLNAMQSALARFARKADAADLSLIYYSGHGIEVDGTNYLIPVSAKLIDAGDADFETVPLDQALKAADRAGKVKIVVLDACRNNPFRARMLRAGRQGKRSVGRGLAAPAAAANGMLVAYAARAGSEADDGPKGGNSPFTAAFLKFVESPRVDLRIMLGRVRDEVVRATARQEPFTYGSLGGEEVFLNPGSPPKPRPELKWVMPAPEEDRKRAGGQQDELAKALSKLGFKMRPDTIVDGGTTLGSTRLAHGVSHILECAGHCTKESGCTAFYFANQVSASTGKHSCVLFGGRPQLRATSAYTSGTRF